MYKILFILTVLICAPVYAANIVNCTETNGEKFCVDEKNKPITGKIVMKYDNGFTKSLENLKNGYRNGLVTEYTENGLLDNRTYYKMGVKNGMSKSYHGNRNVKIRSDYQDGLLDGVTEIYDSEGNLAGKAQYKKGKLKSAYCTQGKKHRRVNFSFFDIENFGFNQLVTCGQQ